MQLTLKPGEAELLAAILNSHLSDLRMEISNTESYELREALKREEVIIKDILPRLASSATRRVA